jgi:hypothetical protein
MTNLITNKHKKLEHAKKPSVFQKRLSARRLRHGAANLDDSDSQVASRSTKHAARKRSGVCPICLGTLVKNASGTRYVRSCGHCKGQLDPELRCDRCGTRRVWSNKSQSRCKGCGNLP